MISHAPAGYLCPFCRNIREGAADHPLEILHRDEDVFVKMNPKWWPNNPGSVLVVPAAHHENIFDLPVALAASIHSAARAAAIAMKDAFESEGVSTRQHDDLRHRADQLRESWPSGALMPKTSPTDGQHL